jgi:methyltransferase (TIGR00027 family)
MAAETSTEPDNTAVRTALWRALHVEVDPPPHVLDDRLGLALADPPEDWRDRPDMDVQATARNRAGIVARARFVEDLVEEQLAAEVDQLVLLGAGLDTLAQRRPDLAARVRIFEIDRPGTQQWKRRRLVDLGLAAPIMVPVDFETGSWWDELAAAGFDPGRPAVVSSTGVAMYLTDDTNAATLRTLARLAAGSTVAMTFQLVDDLLDQEDLAGRRASMAGARAAGTPFLSFYAPEQMRRMALDVGFVEAVHVGSDKMNARYFAGRPDGLATSRGEEMLFART